MPYCFRANSSENSVVIARSLSYLLKSAIYEKQIERLACSNNNNG